MMRPYIEQLKAITAEADRQREEQARAKRPPLDPRMSEHWKPLTEQLKELFSSYTPSMRVRPFSISELLPHLHGHYRPRPSRGDVGQALKALGWVPSRDWSVQGGSGRRVWILPDTD